MHPIAVNLSPGKWIFEDRIRFDPPLSVVAPHGQHQGEPSSPQHHQDQHQKPEKPARGFSAIEILHGESPTGSKSEFTSWIGETRPIRVGQFNAFNYLTRRFSPKTEKSEQVWVPRWGSTTPGAQVAPQRTPLGSEPEQQLRLNGTEVGDRRRERFRCEARTLAQLAHPGIVQIFDRGSYRLPIQSGPW